MRCLLMLLIFISSFAYAQTSRVVYTVLVRSGSDLVKLLVEKRGDLAVGIVGGSIVTLSDHALTGIFADKPKPAPDISPLPKPCNRITGSISACGSDLVITGERTISHSEIQRLLERSDVERNVGTLWKGDELKITPQFQNILNTINSHELR